VTVEHTNATIKSFRILGSKYRGKRFSSDTFLSDAIAIIIINTVALHATKIPLRVHHQLPGFPVVGASDPALAAAAAAAAGPAELPVIDTSFTIHDFAEGDDVEYFDWSVKSWVRGVIHHVGLRVGSCIVRVRGRYVRGVLPSHMQAVY